MPGEIYIKMRCFFSHKFTVPSSPTRVTLLAVTQSKKFLLDNVKYAPELASVPAANNISTNLIQKIPEHEKLVSVEILLYSRHFVACSDGRKCVVVNFGSQSPSERLIHTGE